MIRVPVRRDRIGRYVPVERVAKGCHTGSIGFYLSSGCGTVIGPLLKSLSFGLYEVDDLGLWSIPMESAKECRRYNKPGGLSSGI